MPSCACYNSYHLRSYSPASSPHQRSRGYKLKHMVDIHCHILPEVDDGPKSWEASLEMCRLAIADGVEHIVATPHANDRFPYDREYLSAVVGKLRELIQRPEPKIT